MLQTLGNAAVTLTVGGNGQNTTFSGALGGNGGLFKTGSGTLTLTSTANNFSGALTVNNGVLEVTKLGNQLNGSGPITLGGSGPATLRYIGDNDGPSRPINLARQCHPGCLGDRDVQPGNNLYFSRPVERQRLQPDSHRHEHAGGESTTINLAGGSARIADRERHRLSGSSIPTPTSWRARSSTPAR